MIYVAGIVVCTVLCLVLCALRERKQIVLTQARRDCEKGARK